MKLIKKKHQGVTFVEILVVLVMLSVLIGVFYTFFFSNWKAYEERIARADMWQQADETVESISQLARQATSFTVSETTDEKTILINNDFNVDAEAIYKIKKNGAMEYFNNAAGSGVPTVLAENINFDLSTFERTVDNAGLLVKLVLEENVLGRVVDITTSTEVYLRN